MLEGCTGLLWRKRGSISTEESPLSTLDIRQRPPEHLPGTTVGRDKRIGVLLDMGLLHGWNYIMLEMGSQVLHPARCICCNFMYINPHVLMETRKVFPPSLANVKKRKERASLREDAVPD